MDCPSHENQNMNNGGSGSSSTRKKSDLIGDEDLELSQNISRSRNPSSDLVIAPEPVLAEVTKADINRQDVITIYWS